MSKKYTDQDLLNLIAEVEVEFKKHLDPTAEGEKIEKTEEVKAQTNSESPVKTEEFDYDEEDKAEMEKLYRTMSKAEANAHFETLKKAMGVEETPIAKSESSEESKLVKSENETLKSENSELKKSLEKVTEVLTKVFGKGSQVPKQKAITSMEVIKKSEEENKPEKDLSKLSKKEVNAALSSKIKSGSLEKNDQEAIYKYFDNGSIELIKHLL